MLKTISNSNITCHKKVLCILPKDKINCLTQLVSLQTTTTVTLEEYSMAEEYPNGCFYLGVTNNCLIKAT